MNELTTTKNTREIRVGKAYNAINVEKLVTMGEIAEQTEIQTVFRSQDPKIRRRQILLISTAHTAKRPDTLEMSAAR